MCSLRFESIRKHWIMILFILAFLIGTSGAVSSAENFDSVIYSRTTFGTSAYSDVICTKNGYSCGSEEKKKGVQSRSETPIKEKMKQAIFTCCYSNGKRLIAREQDGGVNGTCKDAMGVL